jgi:hypothetical protein
MSAAKAAGKAAMLKGMVHMITGVVRARVVTHPLVLVHVRDVGMTRLVLEVAILFRQMGRALNPVWTAGRGLLAAFFTLSKCGNRSRQQSNQCNLG